MTTVLPSRPSGVNGAPDVGSSFSSFPAGRGSPNATETPFFRRQSTPSKRSQDSQPISRKSSPSVNSRPRTPQSRSRKLKSQYPRDAPERHVEYILVASFDIDRGPIMEHQYPGAISPDENMLAELMLPDQTHVRSQDWTIFFLHKDAGSEEEEAAEQEAKRQRRLEKRLAKQSAAEDGTDVERDMSDMSDDSDNDEDDDGGEPPLMYVLNLVNTKQDNTVKRGAVVKAMAICTRHSFLHIYKPLLLLALEDYFKSPYPETLASLYNAVNAMDLSLMPRLSVLERHILQSSDAKDMFAEKFERMIRQRQAEDALSDLKLSPGSPSKGGARYAVPRDTHEFETKVIYHDIPIPIKVPTAVAPETVGDFSLVKLIQTFGGPHISSPQPFALHPHLTTSGAYTHPIIILINALLTQKRVIFLGHNCPSGEVAEAVLAACALASGGVLRGFTRHAFPYTDLTKIDDLLKVPGFIAGVTNPAFANHHEWWDLLCDLPSGRMKISSKIEAAPMTQGLVYFQQQNPGISTTPITSTSTNYFASSTPASSDPTGDTVFMEDIARSITSRHGESAIRSKFRSYTFKFTRMAAAFEESVYGASALYIIPPSETDPAPSTESPNSPRKPSSASSSGHSGKADFTSLRGHGYVWSDANAKARELAASVSRIEGWRNTRSYYTFISDLAFLHSSNQKHSRDSGDSPASPPVTLDIHHHHDRLRLLRLSSAEAGAIYLAFAATCMDYVSINQLLVVTPESQGGLFYVSLGLWHPDQRVREAVVNLLERVGEHEAGRHYWGRIGGWVRLGKARVARDIEQANRTEEGGDEMTMSVMGGFMGESRNS
ncbi:MAG: hypothetical protein Q9227_002424 [Pyrenula ochraceoflavens]